MKYGLSLFASFTQATEKWQDAVTQLRLNT